MASARCPKCGMTVHRVKPPGQARIADWDGPLMLFPCCHVVDRGELEERARRRQRGAC